MKCPKCGRKLVIIPFEDGVHAGRCEKCNKFYTLVMGINGYEISCKYKLEGE